MRPKANTKNKIKSVSSSQMNQEKKIMKIRNEKDSIFTDSTHMNYVIKEH